VWSDGIAVLGPGPRVQPLLHQGIDIGLRHLRMLADDALTVDRDAEVVELQAILKRSATSTRPS
jgi:hypothetical protein